MKKYDYDYWKKMTWNWYAVPDLRTVRYNKSSKSKGVFRLCDVCDYVFHIVNQFCINIHQFQRYICIKLLVLNV